jgi:molybdopterin molybdotransferase
VLQRLGGRKVFWQVQIRPGRPVLFGVVDRGALPPALYFALPGNPAASALTFDLFVRPAIRQMLGALAVRRPRLCAVLDAPLRKPAHLTFLARGRLVSREAHLCFVPASLQGSMSIPSLSGLGGVAFVPEGVTRAEPGDLVEVERWGEIEA